MTVNLAVLKVTDLLRLKTVKLAQTDNNQIKDKDISVLFTLLFCAFPGFATWSQASILYCRRIFESQQNSDRPF